MTPAEKTPKFETHVLEVARIAKRVGELLDLKSDAQQACFATILIAAGNQGVFFDTDPGTAAADKDATAAIKADEQIKDVSRHPTEAEAEAGAVKALREGVKTACRLLNAEGFTPNLRPTTIDDYIKNETELKTPYLEMDSADLEALTKNLSLKLDEVRAKKKTSEDDAGF